MPALSKTAALVMRWARPLYRDGNVGRFVEMLDLSAADELAATCDRICPWYGEVILNRKHTIEAWTREWLSKDGNDQVVILAAGMDPLSLEILELSPQALIVEVDIDGMEAKRDLYSTLVPDLADHIVLIPLDICDMGMLERIRAQARRFDPRRPTLFIMEGISYYLKERELATLLSRLTSDRRHVVILDYLVPEAEVAIARRPIPCGVFGAIAESTSWGHFSRYSNEDIASLTVGVGGTVAQDLSMDRMERLRRGRCDLFPDEVSGWIRCAMIRL